MFFNWDSLFTGNHSHFQPAQMPLCALAPTLFGECQLERSGNRPLSRVAGSAETQLPAEQPLERVHRQAVDLQFIFNPCIDVTLASIHIPPSMWGSNCEGDHFGLSGS